MLSPPRRSLSCLCLTLLLAKAGAAYPVRPELPASTEAGSPFTLSLRAGAAQDDQGSREAFALLTLTLALDRIARGALPATNAEPELEQGAIAQASPPTPAPATPAPAAPRPPAQRVSAPRHEAISPALARGAVEAALRVQGGALRLERIASMAARARTRAALPELGLRAGTSSDTSLRLTPIASDPARFSQSGGRDLFFEARLTWKLDRALFSDDEVAIERLSWGTEQARERLVQRVLELLFDWQEARLELARPLDDERYRKAWLASLRAAAELDVLTEGWFSRRVGLE
ncbi:MAG: hypothetical protein ABW217_12985 [Polyangiaceae bacterium]